MKKRIFNTVVLSTAILLIVVLSACRSEQQVEKEPMPVKVATIELHSVGSEARYSATIIPRTQVELAFKVGGYVEAIQQVRGIDGKMRDLQEGDSITTGAVLAQVRQSDYQVKFKEATSQAAAAKSAIDASKAQYQEALSEILLNKAHLAEVEADFEKAKLDFERAQNLLSSKSMTKANYDAAKSQYELHAAKVAAARSEIGMIEAKADSAKAQIEVIEARFRATQAGVQEAAIPLQDTALKSPLNGLVLQKSVEKGTLVSHGKAGFIVADTSSVKAVFGVADVAVQEMKLGKTLSVVSESMPGKEFRGQITSIFPGADPKSRTFNVEVTIPNQDYLLRPGMIVSLKVGNQEVVTSQPTVPLSAVIKAKNNTNGYAVFVVTEQSGHQIARLREVKLGESYGNTIAVTDGLKQGERVITTGGTLVTDGDKIKVIP